MAVYYGGHQASLLAQGKHPLKAKTITVLSTKGLTEEHQPKRDSGRCVLLHEMVTGKRLFAGSDDDGARQVYRRDLVTGETLLVSRSNGSDGLPGSGSSGSATYMRLSEGPAAITPAEGAIQTTSGFS